MSKNKQTGISRRLIQSALRFNGFSILKLPGEAFSSQIVKVATDKFWSILPHLRKKSRVDKRNFKGCICIASLYIYIVSSSKTTKEDEKGKEKGRKYRRQVDVVVVVVGGGSLVGHSFMTLR